MRLSAKAGFLAWSVLYGLGVACGHVVAIWMPGHVDPLIVFSFNLLGVPLTGEAFTAFISPRSVRRSPALLAARMTLLAFAQIVRYYAYTRPFVSTTSDEVLMAWIVLVVQCVTATSLHIATRCRTQRRPLTPGRLHDLA